MIPTASGIRQRHTYVSVYYYTEADTFRFRRKVQFVGDVCADYTFSGGSIPQLPSLVPNPHLARPRQYHIYSLSQCVIFSPLLVCPQSNTLLSPEIPRYRASAIHTSLPRPEADNMLLTSDSRRLRATLPELPVTSQWNRTRW